MACRATDMSDYPLSMFLSFLFQQRLTCCIRRRTLLSANYSFALETVSLPGNHIQIPFAKYVPRLAARHDGYPVRSSQMVLRNANLKRFYDSGKHRSRPLKTRIRTDLTLVRQSSSSADSKQSTARIQTIFADRARGLETGKKNIQATENVEREAEKLTKKEAMCTKEDEERLEEERMAREGTEKD